MRRQHKECCQRYGGNWNKNQDGASRLTSELEAGYAAKRNACVWLLITEKLPPANTMFEEAAEQAVLVQIGDQRQDLRGGFASNATKSVRLRPHDHM